MRALRHRLLDRHESYRSGKLEEEKNRCFCYVLRIENPGLVAACHPSCALINHHPYPRSVLAKHKRKLPPVRLAFRDVDPSAALPGYQSRATTLWSEVLRVVCGEGASAFFP
jgi:hypothetical protein